jgi:hypothetical protein
MYVVYLVKYKGEKLPPYYVGSTNLKKIENGYRGSIKSKKYKKIFKEELKKSPELFEYEILSEHKTRKEALKYELNKQIELDVVKSNEYFNESLASVDGMFGRDVSGELNPMFGKTNEIIAIDVRNGEKIRVSKGEYNKNPNLSGHTLGMVTVLDNNSGKFIKIKINEYDSIKHTHLNVGKKHDEDTKLKLSEMRKGYITAKDWGGKFHRIHKNDIRFKNGEFGNTNSKRCIIWDLEGKEYKVFNFRGFFKENGLQRPNKKNIDDRGVIHMSGIPKKLKPINGWRVKFLD